MQPAPEALRERVYAEFGIENPPEFGEDGRSRHEWEHHQTLAIPYFMSKLRGVLTPHEAVQLSSFYYMTAPVDDLNAMILRVASDTIIVFNLATFAHVLQYIEWLQAAAKASLEPDRQRTLDACCHLMQIAECSVTGKLPQILPHDDPYDFFQRPNLGAYEQKQADAFAIVAHTFVIGHEFGHFVLGHLDQPGIWQRLAPDSSVEKLNGSQQAELDADRFAFELISRSVRPENVGVSLAMIFGLFHVSEVARKMLLARSKKRVIRNTTHPSAEKRMRAIRERLKVSERLDRFWEWSVLVPQVALNVLSSSRRPAG